MPAMRLTKKAIDDLSIGAQERSYWDDEVPGFAIKVTPAGKKVFFIKYRMGGRGSRQRKYTIGTYGQITLVQARDEARRILGDVARGIDPQEEKLTARRALGTDKIASLVARFLTERVSRDRSAKSVTGIFKRDVLPEWGTRSVHEITKRDVNALLQRICSRGAGVLANRTLGSVRRFFNWCRSQGISDASPCDDVKAPVPEVPRERYLSNDELRRVLLAARELSYPYGIIVELLALTAQRKNEVARLEWDDINFGTAMWTLPAAKAKSGRAHKIHLTTATLDRLARCPRRSPLVFTTNGRTPVQDFSGYKERLDALAGVTGWTLHDLRRTVATGMADLGIAPHVIDKILNHQSGVLRGVAAIYQRNEFLAERQDALQKWAEHISELIGPPADNVVHIGHAAHAG
jgi:integrase